MKNYKLNYKVNRKLRKFIHQQRMNQLIVIDDRFICWFGVGALYHALILYFWDCTLYKPKVTFLLFTYAQKYHILILQFLEVVDNGVL